MTALLWDQTSEKLYETGVSNLAFYPMGTTGKYEKGIAWNGVTGISENPSGGEPTALYADNVKYLDLMSNEEFGCTLEAYTYPIEFEQCDGTAELAEGISIGQQKRTQFGMVYKTLVGNDTDNTDHGYKLHIVYGCRAKPSSKSYSTVNNSPEAITFSWEISTTPTPVDGHKPTSCVTIDSNKVAKAAMKKIEEALYGTTDKEPTLLLPNEIAELVTAAS